MTEKKIAPKALITPDFNETAESYFKKLFNDGGIKRKKSLEAIRVACDLLIDDGEKLEYKRVSDKSRENDFPEIAFSERTIYNNKELATYITMRDEERVPVYQVAAKTQRPNGENGGYPTEGLDADTKKHILKIEGENKRLVSTLAEMSGIIANLTSKQPISLLESFTKGPHDNLSMELLPAKDANFISAKYLIFKTLKNMMDLHKDPGEPFFLESKNGMKALMLKRPSGNRMLIDPSEWEQIESLLKEPIGGQKAN